MIVQYYYSVDGVEHGPFGPATSPLSGGSEPVVASIVGLAVNDSLSNHAVDVSYNNFKIGHTGYGSTEIFSDTFSSSGFTSWDRWLDGTPGTYLTEGSGVARLVFASEDIVQVTLEKWDHDLDHDNVYWTMDVKCPVATAPFPKFYVYDPDGAVLSFQTDQVGFSFLGVGSDTTAVDLDDGNWHTLGVRRERLTDAVPVEVVATISHVFGLDT